MATDFGYDLIVIGGGPAGVTAALRARELGARAALVERGRLGGTCTNDGCAPTRVLAKAARLVRDAEQLEAYGLTPHAPAVDLPRLLARTQQVVYRLQEKKQLIDHLAGTGVVVFDNAGPARFIDAHTLALPSGRTLTAEKFILAAGGHARRLPFPGAELALTHSDVWTLTRLPRSLAVVGAAATGCQLASIFAAFGTEVHLLEVLPRLVPAEDEAVSAALQAALQARGLNVITGLAGMDRIEKTAAGLALHYRRAAPSNGSAAERVLAVEAVVLSVGWVGNLEALNLEAAGVASQRGYVSVDDTLRTSAANIWAAGDITGRMMLVQSAGHDARVAVENALLGSERKYRHTVVPHGGFTDPEYGSVGLTEAQARAQEPACAVALVPFGDIDRAVIDDRAEGFCKLIVSRQSHAILGAHVVGEQAVEIVQIAAAGMAAGMKVEQLAELELAYPTFTAILGLAARQIVRGLGLTPVAEEWRTLKRLAAAEWERGDGS
ncbi:MAG: NAD(P)/FAD-dependent oxidoreductase [Anaerolineales bacterium]|nr:NAD(P)/FAD-dependent oxidoreductase [Anaerolineales bacterium]